LEAGWSSGEWPATATLDLPSEISEASEARFRICHLWSRDGLDHWWQFAPRRDINDILAPDPSIHTLLPKADGLIDDALRRVREHVLPYFETVRRALE